MKLFNKNKVFALAILCLFASLVQASCPVTCPTGVGSPRFCSLAVTGALSAGSLCVQGNESVGGSLSVCGTGTSFVSLTGGAGLTGPIPFSTLSAFGFAYDPAIAQAVTAGNNTVDLTLSSALLNTTFAADALTPLISGIYLIRYIVDLNPTDIGAAGTFSIFVNGATVAGSQFAVTATETGAVVGQAVVAVVAGQSVIINFASASAGTITGTASLALEKIG